MRQLFLSQYKHRNNPILINYQNNYHKFTFIQNDFNHLIKKKSAKSKESKEKGSFTELAEKYKKNIAEMQSIDFKESDLDKILLSASGNNYERGDLWQQNIPVIKQLSQSFISMTHNLSFSLNKDNLHSTVLALTQFNCLQLRTWQRLTCFISQYYKSASLHQRLTFITALSEYMKKFQFSFYTQNKKPAFKFMYPQSYIIDLIDFRELFKSLDTQDDCLKQTDSAEEQRTKLMILQNFIYLIMKATKKADMNIYLVRDYFGKRSKQMIKIAEKYNVSQLYSRVLYNIYFIYSYLNYNDGKFYEQIEKNYFEMLKNKFKYVHLNTMKESDDNPQENNVKLIHTLSKQLNKLLSIWKLNQRSNQQIYHELFKPFLENLLESNLETMYYSNIAINLLTAGITDIEVFDKMILSWKNSGIKDDEFMHMLKHYLNVKSSNLQYESNYHKCQGYQNQKILHYLNKNNLPIFSQCLFTNNTKASINKLNSKPIKGSQHHRTQRIWSNIVRSIFQPKYEVIENVNICNYEIDFLILADKQIYAIEIQGGHYNKKDFNSQTKKQQNSQEQNNKSKTTGKREIREMILKAYNIQFIKIHCEQKLPTYIMQSRNIAAGKKYIIEKIYNDTKVRIENI